MVQEKVEERSEEWVEEVKEEKDDEKVMVDKVEEVVDHVNLLADQLVLPEQMDSTRVLMEQLVMVLMVVMVVYPLVVVPVDLHTQVEEVDLVVLVLL